MTTTISGVALEMACASMGVLTHGPHLEICTLTLENMKTVRFPVPLIYFLALFLLTIVSNPTSVFF